MMGEPDFAEKMDSPSDSECDLPSDNLCANNSGANFYYARGSQFPGPVGYNDYVGLLINNPKSLEVNYFNFIKDYVTIFDEIRAGRVKFNDEETHVSTIFENITFICTEPNISYIFSSISFDYLYKCHHERLTNLCEKHGLSLRPYTGIVESKFYFPSVTTKRQRESDSEEENPSLKMVAKTPAGGYIDSSNIPSSEMSDEPIICDNVVNVQNCSADAHNINVDEIGQASKQERTFSNGIPTTGAPSAQIKIALVENENIVCSSSGAVNNVNTRTNGQKSVKVSHVVEREVTNENVNSWICNKECHDIQSEGAISFSVNNRTYNVGPVEDNTSNASNIDVNVSSQDIVKAGSSKCQITENSKSKAAKDNDNSDNNNTAKKVNTVNNKITKNVISVNNDIANNDIINTNNVNSNINITDNSNDNNVNTKSGTITFYCEISGNWKEMLNNMKNETNIIPDAKLSGELFKIIVKNSGDFRTIQDYLTKHNIPFQTLDPRNERPKKFIFRGIPTGTPKEELESFLIDRNFHPIKIAYLTNRKTKKPMPLFMVSVRPAPNIKDIYNINYFNYLKISVEEYKDTDVKQCYNCQSYGHSSLKCFLKSKCVRCAGQHTARDCPLPKEIKEATCANCGGPHPANYRGCPKNPRNKNKNPKAIPRHVEKNPTQPISANVFVPAPLPTRNRWDTLLNLVSNDNVIPEEDESESDYSETEEINMEVDDQKSSVENAKCNESSSSTTLPPAQTTQIKSKRKKSKKKGKKNVKKINTISQNKNNQESMHHNNSQANVRNLENTQAPQATSPSNTQVRGDITPIGQKTNTTNTSTASSSETESDASDLTKFLKTLLKNINLKKILDFIKEIIDIFSNNNPMDAVYCLLEKFIPIIASFQCHG